MKKTLTNVHIDYFQHPGFESISVNKLNIPEFDKLFNDIDSLIASINQKNIQVPLERVNQVFNEEINPLFERIKQLCHKYVENDDYRIHIIEALDLTLENLLDDASFNNQRNSKFEENLSSGGKKLVDDINNLGIDLRKIPTSEIDMIVTALKPEMDKLTERMKAQSEIHCWESIPMKGEYSKLILRVLNKYGILEGVSALQGHKMVPMYYSLQISQNKEEWYKDCYADVGLITSKTSYMHYDQSDRMYKTIFYLGEVTQDSGPFQIIKGSQNWDMSISKKWFFKFLDHANAKFTKLTEEDDGYYRPMFRHKKFREEFLKLPVQLQGSSHFGDDVLDGSELSNFLLEQETTITSELGNLFTFVGGQNIHRGGMVNKGTRWALQIGYKEWEPKKIDKNYLKHQIKQLLMPVLPKSMKG